MKRVVFIGASRFGLRCLDAIRSSSTVEAAGVLTVPREFPISYAPQGVSLSSYGDFTAYAADHGLPCHCMSGSMKDPEVHQFLSERNPDCMIVVGWYHLLPKSILDIAPVYGLHASLLPDYSGGAPLVWAIINGETNTGITLFQMKPGVDNGPVLGSRATRIDRTDTIRTLYERVEDLGIELVLEHLGSMADGTAVATPQIESDRRVFPQRTPADGEINWHCSSEEIYDFVRAQTRPYPGAFSMCRGEKVTIWESTTCTEEKSRISPAPPGTVVRESSDSIMVFCGDGKPLILGRILFRDLDHDAFEWHDRLTTEEDSILQFQQTPSS